jgi:signal transduction histidine kinase
MESSGSEKLEAAFEALRKCEERLIPGQFALEVMHEIRNPLDALGNLVYLAAAAKDIAEVRGYLGAAKEQIITSIR